MSNRSFKAIIPLLLSIECATAQPVQVVIDNPGINGGWVWHVTATTDGNYVVTIADNNKVKFNADGSPLWSKTYDLVTYSEARMPDGGTVFMSYPVGVMTGQSPDWSTTVHFQIARIESNGDLLWKKEFIIASEVSTPADPWSSFDLTTDDSGRVFVQLGHSYTMGQKFVCCITPAGALLWSRILQGGDLTVTPTFSMIAADGVGGCYAIWCHPQEDWGWDYSGLDLAKFNADGSLDWTEHMTVHNFTGSFGSAIANPDRLVISGSGQSTNNCGVLLSINSDGSVGWRRTFAGGGTWHLRTIGNGEIIGARYNPGYQWSGSSIIRLDENGVALSAAATVSMPLGAFDYHVDWRSLDAYGDHIAIPVGIFDQAPWAGDYSQPGLWVLSPEFDGCMLTAIPPNTNDLAIWLSMVPWASLSVSDSQVVMIDQELIAQDWLTLTTSNGCDLPMHVPGRAGSIVRAGPQSSMAEAGSPVLYVGASDGYLDVLDASGRQVVAPFRVMANGTFELPTSSWSRGLYLLRLQSAQEGVTTFKVLVE
ncbi:MAG: T9SS type A sorting domain-containing protein [Flavobacteriales bacterium]|nr:T9SS type A sorting domain-containing protein [Flavobacteriales bacterium]